MDPERIDLSSLDPAASSDRWQQLVEATSRRALATRQRRPSLSMQLLAFARPALACAAALALLTWGAALREGKQSSCDGSGSDNAFCVASWAATGELPATETILDVLGASNEAH
jgi:hypothetical protein